MLKTSLLAIAVLIVAVGCQPAQSKPSPTASPAPPSATANPNIPATQALPTLDPGLPTWTMVGPASPPAAIQITQTVDVPYTGKQLLDVYAPATAGNWPLVIVFHGGDNTKKTVSRLAQAIAERGAVVFVPTYYAHEYTLSTPIARSYEEAACAVRFARTHVAEYGGHADRVIVVGHSFGGTVGALLMLAGDEFHGADCLTQEGSSLPDAFVGLDSPYDLIAVGLIDPAVLQAKPAELLMVNPFTYIGRTPRREDISFLLFVGPTYTVVRPDNQAFRDALQAAGHDVRLFYLSGVNHHQFGMPQPATLDAIASLLLP